MTDTAIESKGDHVESGVGDDSMVIDPVLNRAEAISRESVSGRVPSPCLAEEVTEGMSQSRDIGVKLVESKVQEPEAPRKGLSNLFASDARELCGTSVEVVSASHPGKAEIAGEQSESYWVETVESAVVNGFKAVAANSQLPPSEPSPGNDLKDETPRISEGKGGMTIPHSKSLEKPTDIDVKAPAQSYLMGINSIMGNESGTEEEQAAFMKDLEAFYRERRLEFKPPRFYGEQLNLLKLWKAVIKLGGYEQVTACKSWRQVGESFKPPKTCTTVSWTFRGFYEKALLEYEKHKMRCGQLPFTDTSFADPSSIENRTCLSHSSGSGRARRDAAARAMQGWHSQRLLDNGEVGDPIIKDKSSISTPKREKQMKSVGLLKRKKLSPVDHTLQIARLKAASKVHVEMVVVDIGQPADWVKINVQRTKDCFEVYALVPGLLREEVRVQSDPAGRLVISGQPEQLDNPWGVTPFRKVVSLPSRIDPHQTSAVVTLHGQLFVRVPFEHSDV